jgi:hypothetical protein
VSFARQRFTVAIKPAFDCTGTIPDPLVGPKPMIDPGPYIDTALIA